MKKNESLWLSEAQRESTPVGSRFASSWQTSWPVFRVQDENLGSSSGSLSKTRSHQHLYFPWHQSHLFRSQHLCRAWTSWEVSKSVFLCALTSAQWICTLIFCPPKVLSITPTLDPSRLAGPLRSFKSLSPTKHPVLLVFCCCSPALALQLPCSLYWVSFSHYPGDINEDTAKNQSSSASPAEGPNEKPSYWHLDLDFSQNDGRFVII